MNKYNSITETFTCQPILNDVLSAHATPPADLTLVPGDFTPQVLYATGGTYAAGPRIKFNINDKPRVRGFGLFINIADGLVNINSPSDFENGPGFGLSLNQFDAANANQGLIDTAQSFRCVELNQIWEADYLFDVSGVDPDLDSLRLTISMTMLGMSFSTITVDPAFAAKSLIIQPVLLIEHTFPLTAAT